MNWKMIFNPFVKFDDRHLLLTGMLFFVLNVFGCHYAGNVNDSIFHYSLPDADQGLAEILKINSLSYIIAIAVLFLLGKLLNGKSRLIDIANTVLISQIPLIITIPFTGLPFFRKATESITLNTQHPENLPIPYVVLISIWGLVSLIFLIYSITLFYNGFRTATNIKKWQHIVVFAAVSLFIIMLSQAIL